MVLLGILLGIGNAALAQPREGVAEDPGVRLPAAKPVDGAFVRGAHSVMPAQRWEDAFVTGNGRMGAMLFGNPANETLIANHCRLFLPLGNREIVPDLVQHVPELRRIIREKNYQEAMAFFLGKASEQGYPGLIPTDPFHPGFFLYIRQPAAGPIADYVRAQDFQTGEVTVRWRDPRGVSSRRLFVSRTDNVIVLRLTGPGAGRLDCDLVFPPVSPAATSKAAGGWTTDVGSQLIESTQEVASDWVTFHNIYTRGKGGYDAAVRIAAQGGEVAAAEGVVRVRGADEVVLLMRIVPWKTPLPKELSNAWAYSLDHPDFSPPNLGRFDPAPPLAQSSVVAYRSQSEAAVLLPQLKQSLARVSADCELLREPHARAHGELFNRVTLDLGGGSERAKTTEELLALAKREGRLPAALAEKIYDAGRYMFICAAGELPPNLQGIWTGTWKPAWSGDFTLDTNLQLAMKHALSGNLAELMQGYFRMIEDFYPEWRLNAGRIYGCRGYLTNARASNTALMLHWGKWPGVFWTAGCGWLAHFFDQCAQYTGDREFLAQRTVPFLKEVVAFYEDFVTVDPKTGLYEFIPSYSPESSTGITSTMDVMVCKEALTSLIAACRELDIEKTNVSRWEGMLKKLPPYRINQDGALAEWIPEGGHEYYKHRHLSHLHALYEATDDLTPETTPELWHAAQEAVRRRINSGGERSSHGRAHMGLVAAHLGLAEEAYGRIEIMATGQSMYPSLMCSHEPDARIFNVDANGAMPEIINRMLVRSRAGSLDLLPALPKAWPNGEIRGIRAKRRLLIDRLAWNRKSRQLTLEMTSDCDQLLALYLSAAEAIGRIVQIAGDAEVAPSTTGQKGHRIKLKANSRASLTIEW
jgi:hypothetical protein